MIVSGGAQTSNKASNNLCADSHHIFRIVLRAKFCTSKNFASKPYAPVYVTGFIKSTLNQEGVVTHTDFHRKSTANPGCHGQWGVIPHRVPEIPYYGRDCSSKVRASSSVRWIIFHPSKPQENVATSQRVWGGESSGELGTYTSSSLLICTYHDLSGCRTDVIVIAMEQKSPSQVQSNPTFSTFLECTAGNGPVIRQWRCRTALTARAS